MEREEVDGWFTDDEQALLCLAADTAPDDGAFVEVGVYRGLSARVLDEARLETRPLYLIDNFAMQTADCGDWPPESGFVHHHLCDPTELKTWCVPIALLHQDADHSYEVVLDHLEFLGPFVVPGGYICLHDYGDPTYPGVKRAWEVYSENSDYSPWGRAGHLAIFQRIK